MSQAPLAVSGAVETFNSPPAHTTEGGGIEQRPGGTDGLSFKLGGRSWKNWIRVVSENDAFSVKSA